jgi:hypothetical protein
MAWYIDKDGKTVLWWEMAPGGIKLEDGRVLPDSPEVDQRIFAVHPEENDLLEKNDEGVWVYRAYATSKRMDTLEDYRG